MHTRASVPLGTLCAVQEPAEVVQARERDRAGRVIEVLIVVKAAPQPSRHYGDTVCVAGIALAPLRWARLYPVPFRYLEDGQKFRKYDVVRVKVRDAGSDRRPESLKVDAESFATITHLEGWTKRAPYVEPMIGGSLCAAQRAVAVDLNAPSLAAVRPTGTIALKVSKHPGWNDEQVARFRDYAAQGDLFRSHEPRMLDAPRLKASLRFDCEEGGCSGHQLGLIDWELTAAQRRFRDLSDAELEKVLRERFWQRMYNASTAPAIFVGNQEDPRRRRQFVLLGTYYPARRDASAAQPTLF